MQTDAKRIIDAALHLDANTRAQIAEALLQSLDVGPDFDVPEAWRAEVRRRCAEIDGGAVDLIPGDQVLAELRAELGK